VDRELAVPGEQAGPAMTHIVERLADHPAIVFSRFGEVLLRTRPAIALFGRAIQREAGARDHRLTVYRHPELGEFELYRQVLVDPANQQILLVFSAVPGSASEAKLRSLTTDA
jgi:hypothetical protein